MPQNLISASNSRYNNTEHFNFAIPTTGEYLLRVRWTEEMFDNVGDLNIEQYGLAWSAASVPEPAALVLLLMAATFLTLRAGGSSTRGATAGLPSSAAACDHLAAWQPVRKSSSALQAARVWQ